MDDIYHGARMTLADELFDLTQTALTQCSEQQRTIYQLVHGINNNGTHEPCTLETAARALGISRSAARWHLAMAELAIYKLIARTLITQRQTAETLNLPGIPTDTEYYGHGMSIRTRNKQAYENISLGEGSTQFMRASRIGNTQARTTKFQEIHQKHTQQNK